jgi:PD-(D/E)XK nuclease superfamily
VTLDRLSNKRAEWAAQDLGEPFQPSPGVMVLTATKIRDFDACPRRFGLRHVLRLEADADTGEVSEELALGLALHTELRLRHDHDLANHDEAGFVDPMSPSNPWIAQRVASHQTMCPSTMSGDAVTYIDGECDLQWFRSRRNVTVRGRIDALWLYNDGTLEVRDYKSGSVPQALDDDPAALLYGLLALTHPIAASKQRVSAVRVVYEVLRADQSRIVTLEVDADVIRRAVALVQRIDERIRTEQRFEATPSLSACSHCPYRKSCPFSAATSGGFA